MLCNGLTTTTGDILRAKKLASSAQAEVNPDSSGNYAGQTIRRLDWLVHGDPEQGEAQIRCNPSGEFFYSVWHQHMPEELGDGQHHFAGDDIWFRRIMMPGTFIYE